MQRLSIKTHKKREVLDITGVIEKALRDYDGETGTCHLSVLHTTAALTTADLDPGTDLDMLDAFEEMIPKLRYRHPHNPAHVPDHILSALIGTSVSLPADKRATSARDVAASGFDGIGRPPRTRGRAHLHGGKLTVLRG